MSLHRSFGSTKTGEFQEKRNDESLPLYFGSNRTPEGNNKLIERLSYREH